MAVVRRLDAGEEQRFLDLLDGWPFSDGRRGREFFRKYVFDDHRFRPDNVWVAEDSGRLVTCVQIFPRELRIDDHVVRVGGIGSVFTASSHRRQGLAEQVLEACTLDMKQRGMGLSLLSGTRARWYASLGWKPWPSQHLRLLWNGEAVPRAEPITESDLGDVIRLHAAYSGVRPGCVERTVEDWQTSLRVAGNPDETFTVARRDGRLVAYLRSAPLGPGQVTEWGRTEDGAAELAGLFAQAASRHPLGGVNAPRLSDPALAAALDQIGFDIEALDDPTSFDSDPGSPVWMLKPLDAGPWRVAHHEELAQRLPPSDFCFWPSDRF
ncbi:MAG: GNAT family N-acetyltransferase [Acidobacteriota bacterium]